MADRAIATTESALPTDAMPVGVIRPGTSRRYLRLAMWIALTDVLAVEAAILLTRFLRYGLSAPGSGFLGILILAPFVWVPTFALFNLYSLSRLSPAEEFRRLFEASGVAVAAKLVLTLLFIHGSIEDALSRGWLGLAWILSLLLVLITRQLWHKYMGRLRARGGLSYRTLIVGANEEALRIAHTLGPKPLGYQPVGVISTGFAKEQLDGLPVLGTVNDLQDVIESHGIECVFVASTAMDPSSLKRVTRTLRGHAVEVRVSANMSEILSSRLTVQPVGDLLALSLRPARLTGPQAVAKRTFDLLTAALTLVVLTPMWMTIAVLIRATSRGPVLYRQERVGKDGRSFTMFKFRTMIRGADLLLPQLLERNEFNGGVLFKLKNDPRVTRIGSWLRAWSLDELPQILNVIKGDMSWVGPRPALPNEVAAYEDWHRARLEVRPGITGLWQVGGRSELTFDDYVRLDLFYIENWSVIYDLFILGKTIPAVLMRKGAF